MKKNNASVEMVYISNDYLERLNEYLIKNNNTTTAHWNKKVFIRNRMTKFFRPMVCLNFDQSKKYCQCFSLSSFKVKKDNINDSRYEYFIDGTSIKGKIVLTKPVLVPSEYLNIIDIRKEISHADNNIKPWLLTLLFEKKHCEIKKELIYNHYLNIKYSRNAHAINYSYANSQIINESQVKQFCEKELELIKHQELLAKSKQNQGGGQGGTPIEEGKEDRERSMGSAKKSQMMKF
ncbi:MAG: hypothetical protein LBT17_01015 [Mycoplasmataceae bacterium]|jgi:hypothetical protein|nr:hypothetical protein [Mycoplasmataceae bacterium]